jgi:hypothetical protein
VKCSQRAPSQHRQVARASQRLTGPWRPQRHVQMAFRDRTVVLPLSALESRAATPPGRQRAASSASGRTIAGRSSDLIRTLFHPRKGVERPRCRRHRAWWCSGRAIGPWDRHCRRVWRRIRPKKAYEQWVRRASRRPLFVRKSACRCARCGLCYSLQPIYLH